MNSTLPQRLPYSRDSSGQVAQHQLRLEAQDAIAGPAQKAVTPRIGGAPTLMNAAIHFDDEPRCGSEEIAEFRSCVAAGACAEPPDDVCVAPPPLPIDHEARCGTTRF
jgi:hypothetical protein